MNKNARIVFEAWDKFQQYEETAFRRRTTVIEKIPKLYMKEIDVNQYFSVGQPIITRQTAANLNQANSIDRSMHEEHDAQQRDSPAYAIEILRYLR